MKKKYSLMIALAVLLAIAITLRLAGNKKHIDAKKQQKQPTGVRIPVKVSAATEITDSSSIVKTGNIAAFRETKIFATASGIVRRINFELGSQVSRGQLLVVMDTRQNNIELAKAESKANKLQSDVQTYTELLEGKATTREKLDGIKQDYKDALSEVEQARRLISESELKAPISGTVSEKLLESGVYVSNGTELGTIIDLSHPKVQVWATESEVYSIQVGQQVRITTDVYPDASFAGAVGYISPQADEAKNYLVEILVTNRPKEPLRSGTFVNAAFRSNKVGTRLVVPREALVENMESPAVYVVEAGKAALRKIQTGRELNGLVEVRSGLAAGQQIVTSGQINLKDGTAVSIAK